MTRTGGTSSKRRRRYAPEFKAEAVRLITVEGRPTSEVARELDVSVSSLNRWRRAAAKDDHEVGGPGQEPGSEKETATGPVATASESGATDDERPAAHLPPAADDAPQAPEDDVAAESAAAASNTPPGNDAPASGEPPRIGGRRPPGHRRWHSSVSETGTPDAPPPVREWDPFGWYPAHGEPAGSRSFEGVTEPNATAVTPAPITSGTPNGPRGLVGREPRRTGGGPKPPPPRHPPTGEGDGRAGDGGLPDLERYWTILRERYRTVWGVAALVVLAVAIGTLRQPFVYRAVATIEIRRQAAEAADVETLFQAGGISSQYLETQYEILASPDLARRVIRELDLVQYEEFNPAIGEDAEAESETEGPPRDPVESALRRFDDRLTIDPIRESRLIRVYFESEDPELSARAAAGVVNAYIQMRVESGQQSVARLAEQADSVRQRLIESEAVLQAYWKEHGLTLLEREEEGAEFMAQQRLRRLEEQLSGAEAERFRSEAQYRLVEQGDYGALNSPILEALTVRVAELSGEYARLRSTFSDSLPRTREVKRQLEAMQAQLDDERLRIASEKRGDYDAATTREALFRSAVQAQRETVSRSVGELAGVVAEYRILEREVAAHQDLYSSLQQKQRQAEVAAALAATEVGIVDHPVPPLRPIRPSRKRNAMLGVFLGLLLGIAAAFVRELTDPTIRTPDEVREFADVPVMALIPTVASSGSVGIGSRAGHGSDSRQANTSSRPAARSQGWLRIDREGEPQEVLAEAFGGLRTSFLYDHQNTHPQVLQVSSARPGEGKTTVAVNLAISLSRLGRPVLLIDADLRRPSIHRALETDRAPGLSDYLTGSETWDSYLAPPPAPLVDVMTAGSTADHPSELLSARRMEDLIEEVRLEYSFVIVDSPAVMVNVPDARILKSLTDGTVLVLRSGTTRRALAEEVLRQVPDVIGIVLNDVESHRYSPYYGDYRSEGGARDVAHSAVATSGDGGSGGADHGGHGGGR